MDFVSSLEKENGYKEEIPFMKGKRFHASSSFDESSLLLSIRTVYTINNIRRVIPVEVNLINNEFQLNTLQSLYYPNCLH